MSAPSREPLPTDDTERLDWLEAEGAYVRQETLSCLPRDVHGEFTEVGVWAVSVEGRDDGCSMTLREAIDRARRAPLPPETPDE
jgi:hypothetical protein